MAAASARRELAQLAHRRRPSLLGVALAALAVGLALGALLAQLGCGYRPRGGDQVDARELDASPAADATPDAPMDAAVDAAADAPPGTLPIDSVCVPIAEECDPTPLQPLWPLGLTCRIRGAKDGRCRPIGPVAAGGRCGSEDDCGANMTCLSTADGFAHCFVVCDTLQPLARCTPAQICAPFVGPRGVCT